MARNKTPTSTDLKYNLNPTIQTFAKPDDLNTTLLNYGREVRKHRWDDQPGSSRETSSCFYLAFKICRETITIAQYAPDVASAYLPLPLPCFHLTVKICRKTITIIQCAPKGAPVLAFYCAKLYLIIKDCIVSNAAKGKCICFFGSCSAIDREIPIKGINLNDIVKARCAKCTPRGQPRHAAPNELQGQPRGYPSVGSPLIIRR
ncbi:hypothetical protein FNYG_13962 [Fusarium nygamai]|uniref:Uncharacterized protein n=1 Tax=Gibberella nygamai TaxID=42673 RepID=A0A2K0UU34_GIBNY|nr:hypothetical protein FNYG_13962 [Fusarium nygamai]